MIYFKTYILFWFPATNFKHYYPKRHLSGMTHRTGTVPKSELYLAIISIPRQLDTSFNTILHLKAHNLRK